MSMENYQLSHRSVSPFLRWWFLILLGILAVLFFHSSLSTGEKPLWRWFVFLIPFSPEQGASEATVGSLLYAFLSIGFYLLFYGVCYRLGALVFRILGRIVDLRKSLGFCEKLFFYIGSGVAVLSLIGTLVALFYHTAFGRVFLILFLLVLAFDLLLSLGRIVFRTDWKMVPNRFLSYCRNCRSIFWERITPFSMIGLILILLLAFVLFVLGMTPSIEYDFLEYHAQGAREFLETGTIPFFSHNAYMNMPLGSEIIYYWGDLLWTHLTFLQKSISPEVSLLFLGTCSAKGAAALLAILTGLGIFSFVHRFFSGGNIRKTNRLAITALLIYFAFPNSFCTFIYGLNDGILGFATLGAFYAFFLAVFAKSSSERLFWSMVSGIFTGFAASIKYTAIPFVAVPLFLGYILFLLFSKRKEKAAFLFRWEGALVAFFGMALFFGGFWYLKNFCYTGNPFWPLAYSLFGDSTSTWSPEIAARWHAAHSASGGNLLTIFQSLIGEYFTSAMVIFIALLFFGVRFKKGKKNGTALILLIYFFFFIALWLVATHRLSRFLQPVLPVLALLLALGFFRLYESFHSLFPRVFLASLLFIAGFYALCLDKILALPVGRGWQNGTSYRLLYGDAPAYFMQGVPSIGDGTNDSNATEKGKLLLLGEARGFAYQNCSILYSTCWNRSPLVRFLPESYRERVLAGGDFQWTESEKKEFQSRLAEENVAMILADLREIRRFLSPGNYGLTDERFFTPVWFQSMEKEGIIKRYSPDPAFQWREKEVYLWRVIPQNSEE